MILFQSILKLFFFSLFLQSCSVWLGGLFTPEAYITATRQFVAQANSWSLEELVLNVKICDNVKQLQFDDCSFVITGLKLQGASCKNDVLSLSSHVSNDLPVATIKWSREQNATNANMSKVFLL